MSGHYAWEMLRTIWTKFTTRETMLAYLDAYILAAEEILADTKILIAQVVEQDETGGEAYQVLKLLQAAIERGLREAVATKTVLKSGSDT